MRIIGTMNIVKQASGYHRKWRVPLRKDCCYRQGMVDHKITTKASKTAMNPLRDFVGGGQYLFCFGQVGVGCHALDEVVNRHWLLPTFFRCGNQSLCIPPIISPLYSSKVLHLVFFCNIYDISRQG